MQILGQDKPFLKRTVHFYALDDKGSFLMSNAIDIVTPFAKGSGILIQFSEGKILKKSRATSNTFSITSGL